LYSERGSDQVYGIGVDLFGVPWVLATDIPAPGGPLTSAVYRPSGIIRCTAENARQVDLRWDKDARRSNLIAVVSAE
jgi:hypothetical protein